jgi:hypothetical protein
MAGTSPAMTAGRHLFAALSREAAPDQAGIAWPFRKSLLPGDRIELLQPILHGLAEVITAAAERAVTLLDEIALLPGQRQRRASPLPSFTRCYVLTCIRA